MASNGLGFSLTVRDSAAPGAAAVADAISRDDVRQVMGRAAVNRLVEHFNALDGFRVNQIGGARTHFYRQAAKATNFRVQGDELIVSVNQVGIGQRYFGGTVTAGQNGSGKKFLTLPAIPEAYGKRAAEFANLRFVFFRGLDLGALVSDAPPTAGGAGQVSRTASGGRTRTVPSLDRRSLVDGRPLVVFWLVRSVTQAPDPGVLPPAEELLASAITAGQKLLDLQFRQAAGNGGGLN